MSLRKHASRTSRTCDSDCMAMARTISNVKYHSIACVGIAFCHGYAFFNSIPLERLETSSMILSPIIDASSTAVTANKPH